MNRAAEIDAAMFAFDTDRMHVRPFRTDDEELYCGLYTDADTMHFIGEPLSPERAACSFRKMLASTDAWPPERLFLTMIDKATQCPLGICAIAQFDAGMTRAEVGIMLKSDARSRGYAREGLGGLLQQTFSMFPVDEIWVEFSVDDPVVERLNLSLGFTPCAEMARKNGIQPKRIWSVHRSSWCNRNAANQPGEDHVERHQLS